MLEGLSGATRIHFIVGHPIAQVKSPAGITGSFARRGVDAIVVPIDVPPDTIERFFETVGSLQNVDGVIATVPHKLAMYRVCTTATAGARLLGVANVMRRDGKGGWHGGMTDGIGFLEAAKAKGFRPAGKRGLLIGAGGAGASIAHSLVDAGLAELSIYDPDRTRADSVAERLGGLGTAVRSVDALPHDAFDLIANASPLGMRDGDPLPCPVEMLRPETHVGDVVTPSGTASLIDAARARGCTTSTGVEMFQAQVEVIADFLLGTGDG